MGIFSFFKKKKAENAAEIQKEDNLAQKLTKEETLISNPIEEKDTEKEKDVELEVGEKATVIEKDTEKEEDVELKVVEKAIVIEKDTEKESYKDEVITKEIVEEGILKTKQGFLQKIARAVAGKSTVDDEVLDNLEEALIMSDVGVDTTLKIIERLQNRITKDKYITTNELNSILKDEICQLLIENKTLVDFDKLDENVPKPYVIMVVGVNGVGKTTTIGKLAHKFKQAGASVVLGAADTFRAAAIEQLQEWGRRVGVTVVAQSFGSDPASVAYDTLKSALSKDVDVVIIDTAGRLHNKVNLMNELSKIKNVMKKIVPDAPHEILLVLDASTGQNAIEQTKQFTAATEVNALALTKLDGTAKGGVVIGISDQFNIPVRYIGVGEKIEDLHLFDRIKFVQALFD